MIKIINGEKTPPTQPPPRTFAALRHRNFQLYFGGQLISNIGTWMQIIGQGWLVYQISHSELTLGIVGFASAIPSLLISPFGGVMVDRVSKRNLQVVTQTASMLLAFILGALSFANRVQVWHVVVLATLLGIVNAFDAPARQAFVVEMVGREDMANAIALNSLMFNSARVIGPAIGGLLLAAVGTAWCFTINGLSFLAVIIGLLAMRLPPRPRLTHFDAPIKLLVEGMRYILKFKELGALLLLALVFSVFGMSYTTLLPAFADSVLHTGPGGYGAITTASGLGAVTGALFIARYGQQLQRGRWLNLANLGFPFILALFAFTPSLYVILLLTFILGVGFMLHFTLINTLLQTQVDDAMRGRVMGLYTLTFFGLAPFGNLFIGALAQAIGLSITIALSAAAALLLSRLVLLWAPGTAKME